MTDLLIQGGIIVSQAGGEEVLSQGDVAISDGNILAVGPNGSLELPDSWEPQRIIKADGKLVLPGFVNAHTHSAMTLFRGSGDDLPLQVWLQERIWPLEARLTDEAVFWGSLLAIGEMLRAGVTCFADMYFFTDVIAQAVAEGGIRAVLAPGLLGVLPDSDKHLALATDFCRRWQGAAEGRITTMLGPHAPYTCQPAYLAQVLDCARASNVGIHIHLAETSQEVQDIETQYGKHPLQYLLDQDLTNVPVLAAHCVHLSNDQLAALAAAGIHVVHNPSSNLKLASGIAPVPQMLDQGINVALGTDGAASNNNLDVLEEAQLAALLHKGLSGQATVVPAAQALEMATKNGALALGLENCCGKLLPGLAADVILINMNGLHCQPLTNPVANLIYSARSADVEMVMVDGEILVEKGELRTLDQEKIVYMASREAYKLLSG